MKIVSREQMVALDHRMIHQGKISEKTLIKRAGMSAARWIASRYNRSEFEIWVLIGEGNNGADAKVVARELKKSGFSVKAFQMWKTSLQNLKSAQIKSKKTILIIDGIFGTGLNRRIEGSCAAVLKWFLSKKMDCVALDIPSGLDADTGAPLGIVLPAHVTLTFGLPKRGLVMEESANDVGELHVLDIGFSQRYIDDIATDEELISAEDVRRFFLKRKRNAHKGSSGHVLVVGGSKGFVGAAALASKAALRTGAGLVSLLVPDRIYRVASTFCGPEIMVHAISHSSKEYLDEESFGLAKKLLLKASAVVIGPGLGRHRKTFKFLKQLFPLIKVPVVLDADGLNLIAGQMNLVKRLSVPTVLTPHLVEMARLVACSRDQVRKNRKKFVGNFVEAYGKTMVLKGSRTLIGHAHHVARGDGTKIGYSINALSGNPGMAVGGTGDVLSGILGALLARGLNEFDASRAGVFLHGRAGDLSMNPKGGNTASDLIASLPRAISSL